MKVFFTILSLIVFSTEVASQVSPVLVRNHPESTDEKAVTEIKWITRKIIHPEGANVYRRVLGESSWNKINDQPIKKAATLPPSITQELPQAADFFYMADSIAEKDINEVGFILINMYAIIFQYNDFAEGLGIYLRDETVQPGINYEYKVALVRGIAETDLGISRSILAGAYQKEDPVEGFNVKQVKKVVELDWKVDDGRFVSYDIYYNIKDSIQNVKLNSNPIFPTMVVDSAGAEVYPSPHFRFSRMEENRYYTFWIEGLDLFGATSQPSDSITFLFNDITPPEPATNFEGKVDSMKVLLNWIPSPSPDLKEHILYRSTKSDTLFEAVKTFKMETDYVDVLSIPGPYFYYLTAVDQAGNKRKSKIVYVNAADIDPPAKPKGLTIVSDTGKLVLSWQANTESDLVGYQILRTIDGDERSHYMLLNSEPYDSTVYVQELPKVVKNKFYYYIVAVDTAYNRSEPSDFAIGQMPDVLPPEQPFIKKVTYEEDNIIVTWVENVENDLFGYNLYRSDSTSELNYEIVNPALISRDAFRFTDRQSEPNKGYLYYLEALDSAGNISFPSLSAYAYRRVISDNDYSKLRATVKYNKQRKSNVIRWQLLEEENIVGYVVFKAIEGQKLKPLTGLLQTNSARDKITASASNTYLVKAYTSDGGMIVSEEMAIKNKVGTND